MEIINEYAYEGCNIWVYMWCHCEDENVALISLLWWKASVKACWWKAEWKETQLKRRLIVLYLIITHWSLMRASLLHLGKHRQETAFMRPSFTDTMKKLWVKQAGKRVGSSPGWRVWTACFGLCVFWPATLCSRHAATRPRKKRSISTDGDLKPAPESTFAALSWVNL